MTKNSPSILVVEDDNGIRESIVEILGYEGFQVHSACDGQEALDLLAGGLTPCWILLDLTMPRMDGIEFLKHIRENPAWSHFKVTLLSAAGHAEKLAKNLQADYLGKPFDLKVLLEKANLNCR